MILLLAKNPSTPAREVAESLGISERKVQRIIAELVARGLITRTRVGRRNVVEMDPDLRTCVLALDIYEVGRSPDPEGVESKKDVIVRRLLRVVDQLLAKGESFASLPVERLIKGAQISRSTFYANFQDKDDLLIALLNSVVGGLQAAAKTWTDLGPGLSRDDISAAMGRIGEARSPHRRVITAASHSESTRVQDYYRDLMTRSAEMVREHIARGQAEGFVRKDVDPAAAALLLTWGTENRLNKLSISDPEDRRIQRVTSGLTDVIWNLLYADVA
jgi:AcrR family transcriptional regulator